MKKVLFFTALIFFSGFLFSQVQGGSYEKLQKAYNKQDFESCLYKAIDMTYNDKTKRDAEPYLYVALCYYQMSLSSDPDIIDDYPKALNNAMKYLQKFKKKDKTKVLYNQNKENINLIFSEYLQEAIDYYNEKIYKKAAYNFGQIAKLYPQQPEYLYIKGACSSSVSDYNGVRQSFTASVPQILAQIEKQEFSPNSKIKNILNTAIINYTIYLEENNKLDSAQSNLNFGLKMFPNNALITTKLDEIKQKLKESK